MEACEYFCPLSVFLVGLTFEKLPHCSLCGCYSCVITLYALHGPLCFYQWSIWEINRNNFFLRIKIETKIDTHNWADYTLRIYSIFDQVVRSVSTLTWFMSYFETKFDTHNWADDTLRIFSIFDQVVRSVSTLAWFMSYFQ